MPHPELGGSEAERFADISEQCHIDLALMEETVAEITMLLTDIYDANNQASIRNRAAAANLAQSFYTGIENVLKRTSKYYHVILPKSEQWHSELAERFTAEHHAQYGLPLLLTPQIIAAVTILRRFRHVIIHGYAMNLDWERMKINVALIPETFPPFRRAVEEFLDHERLRLSASVSSTPDSSHN
jgi:hypothetical protein